MVSRILIAVILWIWVFHTQAQRSILDDHSYDSTLNRNQRKALSRLSREDTLTASPLWPNVRPALFFSNIRENILRPDRINQGLATNFCGYSAMTHLLVRFHPELYLRYMVSLYRTGQVQLKKKTLNPSESIRKAAGTLKNKGELDMLHANQLWFLTLADQFKGYINVIDEHYDPGDENKIWAGTNYGKFNRMLKYFTQDPLNCSGSDLLRPMKHHLFEYLSDQLHQGAVLLYVNSVYLYPHKFSLFVLQVPSHFIVLYDLYKVGNLIQIKYLDYGLKTEQLITPKRLRQLIFGITTILPVNHEFD